LIGHHAGSSLALEIAAVYPDEVFTCCLSVPSMATPEEHAIMFKTLASEWNKPKEDGSHLMKVWNMINGQLWTDLDIKNHEAIDALRAQGKLIQYLLDRFVDYHSVLIRQILMYK
jgi:hypothetical protein